jgi:ATP-binding cassette subfamily B protein
VFGLTILQGAGPVASAWITKLLFDVLFEALSTHQFRELSLSVLWLIVVQVGVSVANGLIGPAMTRALSELGRALSLHVQLSVFRKTAGLQGVSPFETPRFYEMITLGVSGARYGALDSVSTFAIVVKNAMILASFIGILMSFSPILAAVVAGASLPPLYIELRSGQEQFRLASRTAKLERRADYYGLLLSMAQYAKEIRLFGLADHFIKGIAALFEKIHEGERHLEARGFRQQILMNCISALVAGAGFLVLVREAMRGRFGLGDMALYLSALTNVQNSLNSTVLAVSRLGDRLRFVGHYEDLMELTEPLVTNRPFADVPKLTRGIELVDVWFRYAPDGPWVLQGVDLFLPATRCVALVGLNGTGKSTVVKLLTRLYDPVQGAILWDGIDIRNFDPKELRRRLAVIFQDFVRYELTAYENISLGDLQKESDSAAVEAAARKAEIDARIRELVRGYHTTLGQWLAGDEGGAELSGGEWQKIGLARLYFREAEFLILDEPTASLDPQAEYEAFRQVASMAAGSGSLLISHRFSTVRAADMIAVLQNGRIAELGSHQELCARRSLYASLFEMQAEAYRD